jgi:hypothetical protein
MAISLLRRLLPALYDNSANTDEDKPRAQPAKERRKADGQTARGFFNDLPDGQTNRADGKQQFRYFFTHKIKTSLLANHFIFLSDLSFPAKKAVVIATPRPINTQGKAAEKKSRIYAASLNYNCIE